MKIKFFCFLFICGILFFLGPAHSQSLDQTTIDFQVKLGSWDPSPVIALLTTLETIIGFIDQKKSDVSPLEILRTLKEMLKIQSVTLVLQNAQQQQFQNLFLQFRVRDDYSAKSVLTDVLAPFTEKLLITESKLEFEIKNPNLASLFQRNSASITITTSECHLHLYSIATPLALIPLTAQAREQIVTPLKEQFYLRLLFGGYGEEILLGKNKEIQIPAWLAGAFQVSYRDNRTLQITTCLLPDGQNSSEKITLFQQVLSQNYMEDVVDFLPNNTAAFFFSPFSSFTWFTTIIKKTVLGQGFWAIGLADGHELASEFESAIGAALFYESSFFPLLTGVDDPETMMFAVKKNETSDFYQQLVERISNLLESDGKTFEVQTTAHTKLAMRKIKDFWKMNMDFYLLDTPRILAVGQGKDSVQNLTRNYDTGEKIGKNNDFISLIDADDGIVCYADIEIVEELIMGTLHQRLGILNSNVRRIGRILEKLKSIAVTISWRNEVFLMRVLLRVRN